jgi:hypothetical protein
LLFGGEGRRRQEDGRGGDGKNGTGKATAEKEARFSREDDGRKGIAKGEEC